MPSASRRWRRRRDARATSKKDRKPEAEASEFPEENAVAKRILIIAD
jgi:hypothetical protein